MSAEVRLPRNVLYIPGPIQLGGTPPRAASPVPASSGQRDRVDSIPPQDLEFSTEQARLRHMSRLQGRRGGDRFEMETEARATPAPGVSAQVAVRHQGTPENGQGRSSVAVGAAAQHRGVRVAGGAHASVDVRGRGEQEAFVEGSAGVQAGGVGVLAGGRVALRGGSGTRNTTIAQGRFRLSTEATSLEAIVTREAQQRGQPTTTARLEARQQLGEGVSAAAYAQRRLCPAPPAGPPA